MANVTRKRISSLTVTDHRTDPTKVTVHATAVAEFPDTGEELVLDIQKDVDRSTIGPMTFAQIVATAAAVMKTRLEDFRGKMNTVTEEN